MSAPPATRDELRARALALDAARGALEARLAAIMTELGAAAHGALVVDGAPRADVDVHAALILRHEAARLRTDLKENEAAREAALLAALAAP